METIVNNLIKATGWSIFHSLWQAAIIYGVLLLLIAFFPKMTAKLKHNLAYGAISLMFAGFCITFFSIFKLPANDMLISAGNKEIVLMQYASELSDGINQKTEQFFPYIVNVYAIGLLCQLLILAAGYRKLHKLKEADKTSVPEAWLNVFKEMLSRLGLRQPISFYLSDQVNIPLVIGYFKPMVLFPIALVAQLDIKQVEAILIHELSHIRRNDYLLNLIKTAIETLMFFNPFIWLSSRFINIEREHACDDLVLKLTGTPLTYAHALLKLEILKDKTTPALSMAANGSNQHLYQRIKRITDMKTNYMNAKQQIFAITLTIATVISLAWISPEKTEPAFLKPQVPVLPVPPVPAPLSEAKIRHFSNPLVKLNVLPLLRQDTTRKKHKFKIVTIDASGRKQEYNSVKEMPDSLRKEVIKDTFVSKGDFDFNIDSVVNKSLTFTMSPEWQSGFKKMSEDLQKQFSAEEWTKNSEDIKKNSEKMKKFFDSKEWKKQQQDIKKNSERIQLFFNSAEWKNQQKQLIEHSREIAIKLNSPEFKKELDKARLSEKMRLHFSAPIFKQKSEETKTLEASKAYQDLKKKFDEDVETLKKKTIKADTTSF